MALATPITVHVTGPDGSTRASRSTLESIVLGSGPEAAIRIADPLVSSAHCLIKIDAEGGALLIDLGSERGTHLEGRPIGAPVRLQPGQRFAIGGSQAWVAASAGAPRTRLQVALRWGGVLQVERTIGDGAVTLGEGEGCDLPLAHSGLASRHVLATARGEATEVHVPPGFQLELGSDQVRLTSLELEASGRVKDGRLTLGPREVLRLTSGRLELVVRRVEPVSRLPGQRLDDQDFRFLVLTTAALLIFLALATAAAITPVPAWDPGDGEYRTPARYVKLVVAPTRPQELKRLARLSATRARDARRDQAEGRPTDRPAPRPAPATVVPLKAEADRQKVSHLLAGLFGTGPGLAALGTGGVGQRIDTALGGLQAPSGAGDQRGAGGLTARGSGPGGLGGVGLGLGGSAGVGGRAPGAADLGGLRPRETTRVIPGKTTVVGGLDRDVIARVIQRHQSEIKFCYEAELQRDPSLGGKVAVAWTIDPGGSVSEAAVSESSMGSAAVERCILDRLRRWRFPEPRGGGVVAVTFPWIFKAAGDGSPDGPPGSPP
jgi:TonB family protein